MAVEPVAETSGRRGSSTSWRARSAPPITTESSPSGRVTEGRCGAQEERLAGERGERRALARLPDHGIAAHQRERGVPAPHGDREVEGRDDGDGTERMPGLQHAMPGALGRDRAPEELAGEPHREVADVDHLLHLAEALLGDLARLERDERAERLLLAPQLLAEQPHELAAARRRDVPPALEGLRRARDGGVGAGGVAAADVGEQLSGDGRAHGQIAVRERCAIQSEPLEDVVDGEHGVPPSERRRGPDGVIVP